MIQTTNQTTIEVSMHAYDAQSTKNKYFSECDHESANHEDLFRYGDNDADY